MEDTAQNSNENVFIPTSVKEEPESDCETGEENTNNVLDYQVIKAELKDGSDAAMYDCDDDEVWKVAFKEGDSEMVCRGVDGSLKGRLKEETSPDPNGNN